MKNVESGITNEQGFQNSKFIIQKFNLSSSEMVILGDSLFFYGVNWNTQTETNNIRYGIVDVKTHTLLSEQIITDGTDMNIKVPYGIQINPYNGDIYITDAKNYVSSGQLHCYSRSGKKKWSIRTGDIPAHMCFVYR
jgi:hypothetical protein